MKLMATSQCCFVQRNSSETDLHVQKSRKYHIVTYSTSPMIAYALMARPGKTTTGTRLPMSVAS